LDHLRSGTAPQHLLFRDGIWAPIDTSIFDSIDENRGKYDLLGSLEALSRRSYWTRLWITQEVLLASNLRFQWEYYCIPSANLQMAYDDLVLLNQADHRVKTLSDSRMTWLNRRESKILDLFRLSLLHRKVECENIVDKIFGLWALAPRCCQQAVPIDYPATFADILRNTIIHSRIAHLGNGDVHVSDDDLETYRQALCSDS
jgi:hypothetical protein